MRGILSRPMAMLPPRQKHLMFLARQKHRFIGLVVNRRSGYVDFIYARSSSVYSVKTSTTNTNLAPVNPVLRGKDCVVLDKRQNKLKGEEGGCRKRARNVRCCWCESSVCEFLESVGANDRRVPLSSPLPFLASTVLVFSSIVF